MSSIHLTFILTPGKIKTQHDRSINQSNLNFVSKPTKFIGLNDNEIAIIKVDTKEYGMIMPINTIKV